jgi:hypothetical protein
MSLTEEQRGTAAFDLEKARDLAANPIHCPETDEVFRKAIAEIERLRTENKEVEEGLTIAYMIGSDAKEKLMSTRIKALEDALVEERVIGEGGFRAEQCEFWYIEDLPEESCMELDGPCDWAKCPRKHELCDVAYQQLAEEGKIGPDARPKCDHAWQAAIEERGYQTCLKCGECRDIEDIPRTAPAWQITDERKAAIKELSELLTAIGCPSCHYYIQKNYGENITVLRAMLTEAGQ